MADKIRDGVFQQLASKITDSSSSKVVRDTMNNIPESETKE